MVIQQQLIVVLGKLQENTYEYSGGNKKGQTSILKFRLWNRMDRTLAKENLITNSHLLT
jgi:hypothetical protein